MKKKNLVCSLVLVLLSMSILPAQVIGFEEGDPHQPYLTKAEDENVHPTYFLSNYDLSFYHWPNNTTDWQMEYVKVGGNMIGFNTNNTDPYQTANEDCSGTIDKDDHPVSGIQEMGCWMITDEGPDYEDIPNIIEIRFQSLSSNACYEISGLLLDIDGNEAWKMDVYDEDNYSPGDLGSLGTPMYSTYLVSDTWGGGGACSGCATINPNDVYNKNTSGSYLAGDGYPTYWHAKVDDPIKSVIFTYVGHQHKNARFAFDNIKLRQDATEECTTEASFFSSVIDNKGTFIATPQSSAGSTVVGYDWEIDGRKFSDKVLNYSFKRKGVTPVCLTVTTINNNTGECCTDTYCENVQIDVEPEACFLEPSISYQCYTNDCIYKFVGKEGGSNRSITNWYWEFSDGSKYYTKEVFKTFNSPGVYDICLTVVGDADESGSCCTETVCRTIDFSNCNGITSIQDCDGASGPGPAFKTGSIINSDADSKNNLGMGEMIDLELYPNPTTDQVTLTFKLGKSLQNVKVDLVNINGKRVTLLKNLSLEADVRNKTINLPKLSAGMYILELSQDGRSISSEKLLIE